MVYFFLSYARDDTKVYAHKFFDELCSEIRTRAGLGSGEVVGFMDVQGIQPGQPWPADLQRALGRCDSFVALTSPNFYGSEYCGKELRVFIDRVQEYEDENGTRPVAYFPIRWDEIDLADTPRPVHDFQLYQGSPSPTIDKFGLRMAIKLQYKTAYRRFIYELAEAIVRASRATSLPPSTPPPLDQVPAFFGRRSAALPDGQEDWDGRAGFVHFVVAAADSQAVAQLRNNRTYYGSRPEDWMPYEPAQRITELASSIVEVTPSVSSSGVVRISRLPELLEWARANQQIIIVIVDAWTWNLKHNRVPLTVYEEKRLPGTAVMIPLSGTDLETQQNARLFRETLKMFFPQRKRDRRLYRDDMSTHQKFSEDLKKVLVVAQNRVLSAGPGRAAPSGDDAGGPPSLSVP